MVRNLKIPRFETDLVPSWVLDDGTPYALATKKSHAHHESRSLHSPIISSTGSHGIPLMEHLFLNDLMGIFHFTDVNPSDFGSTDTQVKDFN